MIQNLKFVKYIQKKNIYTWSLEWSKYVNAKTRKFKLQKEEKKEITSVKEEKITWDLQLVISGPEEFPLVNL